MAATQQVFPAFVRHPEPRLRNAPTSVYSVLFLLGEGGGGAAEDIAGGLFFSFLFLYSIF